LHDELESEVAQEHEIEQMDFVETDPTSLELEFLFEILDCKEVAPHSFFVPSPH
jgi:hypothetical protein